MGVSTSCVKVSTAGATLWCRPGLTFRLRFRGFAGERKHERSTRAGAATLSTAPSPELAPVWVPVDVELQEEAGAVCHRDLGNTPGHPRNTEGVEAAVDLEDEVGDVA